MQAETWEGPLFRLPPLFKNQWQGDTCKGDTLVELFLQMTVSKVVISCTVPQGHVFFLEWHAETHLQGWRGV